MPIRRLCDQRQRLILVVRRLRAGLGRHPRARDLPERDSLSVQRQRARLDIRQRPLLQHAHRPVHGQLDHVLAGYDDPHGQHHIRAALRGSDAGAARHLPIPGRGHDGAAALDGRAATSSAASATSSAAATTTTACASAATRSSTASASRNEVPRSESGRQAARSCPSASARARSLPGRAGASCEISREPQGHRARPAPEGRPPPPRRNAREPRRRPRPTRMDDPDSRDSSDGS